MTTPLKPTCIFCGWEIDPEDTPIILADGPAHNHCVADSEDEDDFNEDDEEYDDEPEFYPPRN